MLSNDGVQFTDGVGLPSEAGTPVRRNANAMPGSERQGFIYLFFCLI